MERRFGNVAPVQLERLIHTGTSPSVRAGKPCAGSARLSCSGRAARSSPLSAKYEPIDFLCDCGVLVSRVAAVPQRGHPLSEVVVGQPRQERVGA